MSSMLALGFALLSPMFSLVRAGWGVYRNPSLWGLKRLSLNTVSTTQVRDRRRDRPLSQQAAILFLVGPVAFILASLAAVFFVRGPEGVGFLVGMGMVSVLTGAGKFVILGSIAPDAPIGPIGLALLVVAMDTTAAFMLIPVMPLIYRAPILGKFLCRVRQASRQVLSRNPWMRRFTFVGLLTYVAVPFGGTGAVGAVFLGRLLGLRRYLVILGTFLGATIGAGFLLALASLGRSSVDVLRDNPYLTYGVGGVLAAVAVVFAWRVFVVMRSNRKGDCPKGDNFDDDADPAGGAAQVAQQESAQDQGDIAKLAAQENAVKKSARQGGELRLVVDRGGELDSVVDASGDDDEEYGRVSS